jgi:proteasome lid subunit RPN8/RPN11
MFSRFGKIHIIVAHPFDEDSWRCYDKEGRKINLEVLDK